MKKFISLLLSLIMIFSLAVPAFAIEAKEPANPVVIVRGISFNGIRHADGSDAFNVNTGEILGLLLECTISRFALKNEDALYETFAEVVNGVFSDIAPDKDGNITNDVSMKQYYGSMADFPNFGYYDETEGGIVKSAVERYGKENVYFFTYDWRLSAYELATQLKRLIDIAVADHGKQVDIICASMGAMVTNAYFYHYGYNDVNKTIYLSGAHNGTNACGEALTGKLEFNKDIIKSIIFNFAGDNFMLKIFVEIFDILGALHYLTEYFNKWVKDYFARANDEVFRDTFGRMLGLWALCPEQYFDSAVETVFGGHEDEYPVLMEKLAVTGDFVHATRNTLENAKAAGVELAFVSNYNLPLVPVVESADLNGDMTLETVYTSNFATVAKYGEVLSDEYINSVTEKKYISPDNVIDASTAWYRDYTWFVKNAKHVAADYGTEYNDFVFVLIEFDGQLTVDSVEGYPQFLIADEKLGLDVLR